MTASALPTPGGMVRRGPIHLDIIRLGSFLFLVPNILFAFDLRAGPAAIVVVGALSLVALTLAQPAAPGSLLAQPLEAKRLAVCLALAVALLVFGGEAHVMFANWDWLWRDAVLADLARGSFPPAYDVAGSPYILRAPLGMYMLPALVAHWTTLTAGHVALLTQNAIILALALSIIGVLSRGRAALFLIVFLSFSGLDILGEGIAWMERGHSLWDFDPPSHIEGWSYGLQFSSVVTQLFWVPNHTLPAVWLALLALLCAEGELSVGVLGLTLATCLFWSPFAFIGTLPLIGFLFVRDAPALIRCTSFWLAGATALCFLPIAAYLQADAAQVPRAFLLLDPLFIIIIVQFLVLEIPHAAVVFLLRHHLPSTYRGLLVVAIATLVVLPTVKLGIANDLVMRASIPALTLLALAFAQVLPIAYKQRPALFGVAAAIVLVGAVTPATELVRAVRFSRFAISDCNLITVWQKLASANTLENYLAATSHVPPWLMRASSGDALVDQPRTVCWPDYPYDPRSNFGGLSNAMLLRAKHAGPPAPL